ncbi:histidine phosphatase family protein [Flagellimonas sp.]|uniref:histidine phosphatase family protein n=1 Tax=Flagellimonas sp. TaxID=2058762 RepID=UPI003AB321F5
MLNIYLLRHGETQYNADGNKYCGRTDIPLTEKGLGQANQVYGQFQGMEFNKVYSSPLLRASKTAQIASGVNDVILDDRLIEVDFGNWEGKTKEEFIPENEALWQNWEHHPETTKAGGSGETAREVIERVDDFFSSIVQKHSDGETVLVVAHNGINRLYMAHKLGMPLNAYRKIVQENSRITLFTLDEAGNFQLKLLNSRGI